MMLAGIALLDRSALSGTLIYIVGHGLVKAGLFIGTGTILYHFSSMDEEKLRGKCRRLWVTATLFSLSGLALAGLPPFATCAGKAIMEQSADSLGYGWISVIFLISSALTGGAVLRAAGSVFFGLGTANFMSETAPTSGDREPPETKGQTGKTPVLMWLPFLILLCCAFAVGVVPQVAERGAQAAARFTDARAYQDNVLRGAKLVPASVPYERHPDWRGGTAGAALALAVAALFLYHPPLPAPLLRGYKAAAKPAVSLLRSIHSGYIGDYVTWFMIGAAVMMAVAILV
jgi:multicomponent Na+:H+ antiporter subunit D